MFARPTVFIVGAGASAEFGLPTGAELMKIVSDAVTFEVDPSGLAKGDRQLFRLLKEKLASDDDKIVQAAQRLRWTMNSFKSMDEALYYWSSDDPMIMQLGKVAITRACTH
jgi:hypothetical protein